jgi:predicted house-cleaning noncanonical NTP pyrophosphatase (MazG superfamily)
LDDGEFDSALRAKISEEAFELAEAPAESMLDEIADVLEAVDALRRHHGFSSAAVATRRRQKTEERGGFDARQYLVEVVTSNAK